MFAALVVMAGLAGAKDLREVTFKVQPNMRCEKCQNKIKQNVRFAKGVKTINSDLKSQTVTIQYDADKGNVDGIKNEFQKIGYKVNVVSEKKVEK